MQLIEANIFQEINLKIKTTKNLNEPIWNVMKLNWLLDDKCMADFISLKVLVNFQNPFFISSIVSQKSGKCENYYVD